MAVSPLATPSDVDPAIIQTGEKVTGEDIQPHLDYAARKIERHIGVDTLEDPHRIDLEAHYAAFRIRSLGPDRAVSKGSGESSSVTFEGSSIGELKAEVDDLDPSGQLVDYDADDDDEFHFEAF